jgi:putative MATE family efflux protein
MYRDLTKGRIGSTLILFALPMIAGNLLQQFYNIADTLIVGQVLGRDALAAVGSAYTLMTFLTSIFLGLCMGSGALFSIYQGRGDNVSLKSSIFHAFCLIMSVTVVINIAVYAFIRPIMLFLRVPDEVYAGMRLYLLVVFAGIPATSLYNFFSCMLRALGNSSAPLIFLAVSAVLNIALDILFVAVLPFGIGGAALATVIAQYVSGIGIAVYVLIKCRSFLPGKSDWHFSAAILKEILNLSSLTCLQQSVMNFGILMVQGLVNSFGTVVMAAFAAAVKIDTFAYLPVQDFGNAYSTFVAQNFGAGEQERIRRGTKTAFVMSGIFSLIISAAVFIFAAPLMRIFIDASETQVIAAGVHYLRIEGAFYIGIGFLFLLYGYYRAIKRAGMSVVLTVISLGARVLLAYALSSISSIGVTGIWAAIPICWFLADVTGLIYMKFLSSNAGTGV